MKEMDVQNLWPASYAEFLEYLGGLRSSTDWGMQELDDGVGTVQMLEWVTQYVSEGISLRTLEVVHGIAHCRSSEVKPEMEDFLRLLIEHESPVVQDAAMFILEHFAQRENPPPDAQWLAFIRQLDGEKDHYLLRPKRLKFLAETFGVRHPNRIEEDQIFQEKMGAISVSGEVPKTKN